MAVQIKSLFKKILLALAVLIAAAYLVVVGVLFFFQERLIFIATVTPANYQYTFDSKFSEKWFESDGKRIHSILFQTSNPKGVILYLHGNAGTLADWGEIAIDIAKQTGWDVWMIDYPGFGKSEGAISSEAALHKVAEDFWSMVEKEMPTAKKVIYGRSIGTGVAVKLASQKPEAGLVLESPYFSLSFLASSIYPWAPVSILKYSLRSDLWLPNVKSPVLILHGTNDEIIPVINARNLAKTNSKVQYVEVPRHHHNDLRFSEEYWKVLNQWFSAR